MFNQLLEALEKGEEAIENYLGNVTVKQFIKDIEDSIKKSQING